MKLFFFVNLWMCVACIKSAAEMVESGAASQMFGTAVEELLFGVLPALL